MDKFDYEIEVQAKCKDELQKMIDNDDIIDRLNIDIYRCCDAEEFMDEIKEKAIADFDRNDVVSVIGTGSWSASERVCHNLDLLQEALAERGCEKEEWSDIVFDSEKADDMIRDYVLHTTSALSRAVDELEDELTEHFNDKVKELEEELE